jgi:hypothetical protein
MQNNNNNNDNTKNNNDNDSNNFENNDVELLSQNFWKKVMVDEVENEKRNEKEKELLLNGNELITENIDKEDVDVDAEIEKDIDEEMDAESENSDLENDNIIDNIKNDNNPPYENESLIPGKKVELNSVSSKEQHFVFIKKLRGKDLRKSLKKFNFLRTRKKKKKFFGNMSYNKRYFFFIKYRQYIQFHNKSREKKLLLNSFNINNNNNSKFINNSCGNNILYSESSQLFESVKLFFNNFPSILLPSFTVDVLKHVENSSSTYLRNIVDVGSKEFLKTQKKETKLDMLRNKILFGEKSGLPEVEKTDNIVLATKDKDNEYDDYNNDDDEVEEISDTENISFIKKNKLAKLNTKKEDDNAQKYYNGNSEILEKNESEFIENNGNEIVMDDKGNDGEDSESENDDIHNDIEKESSLNETKLANNPSIVMEEVDVDEFSTQVVSFGNEEKIFLGNHSSQNFSSVKSIPSSLSTQVTLSPLFLFSPLSQTPITSNSVRKLFSSSYNSVLDCNNNLRVLSLSVIVPTPTERSPDVLKDEGLFVRFFKCFSWGSYWNFLDGW